MKKPPKTYKTYQWRVMRHRLSQLRLRNRQNREQSLLRHTLLIKKQKIAQSTVTIAAPHVFALAGPQSRSDNRINLLIFIRNIWDAAQNTPRFTIDFSNTYSLHPAATLLFTAELEHLLETIDPKPTITCIKPHSRKISHVFKQVGVYDLLNTRANFEPEGEDVIHWKKTTASGAVGQKVEDVASSLSEELFDDVFLCASEAMTNVAQHAYEAPRSKLYPPIPVDYKRWWMFSEQKNGMLTVAFCDLGMGIPESLPRNIKKKTTWEKIVSRNRHLSDGDIISAATEESVSRMNQSHRGKGMGQIVASIPQTPGTAVTIWSNKGMYSIRHGQSPVTKDYNDSIMGTLITWRVPIAQGITA